MRAVVVGAGVVGCAVGLELRRRGHDVTVLDRNGEVGHGSTSASCGIVRRFHSQPGMGIAMAHEAASLPRPQDIMIATHE
ncbi:MAG: FAD-binding oxidoreductase [bacterium]|nr:FAD-binding oxidoreductase [bacterium]